MSIQFQHKPRFQILKSGLIIIWKKLFLQRWDLKKPPYKNRRGQRFERNFSINEALRGIVSRRQNHGYGISSDRGVNITTFKSSSQDPLEILLSHRRLMDVVLIYKNRLTPFYLQILVVTRVKGLSTSRSSRGRNWISFVPNHKLKS